MTEKAYEVVAPRRARPLPGRRRGPALASRPPTARDHRLRHERVHGRARARSASSRSTTSEDGHEELYFVASGRATFVLGDEEIDAPAGTFIHAEPGTKRGAVATEPNTTVLAIGAKPGVPHEISAWEEIFVVFGLYRSGDEAGAREHMAEGPGRASGRLAGALQRGLPRGADEESRWRDRASAARDRARPEGEGVRGRTTRTSTGCATTRSSRRERDRERQRARAHGSAADRRGRWCGRTSTSSRSASTHISPRSRGSELIEDHDELGERAGRHEELYFVSSGRATFTVNGDEIDAPAGTFVFVRDPAAKRTAIAEEAGTTIVIVGGKPGEAFSPSPWERNAEGLVHFANEDYDKAAETYEQFLAETPRRRGLPLQPRLCREPPGRKDAALKHLRQCGRDRRAVQGERRSRTPTSTRSATTRSSQRSPGRRTPPARARSAGTGSASGRATSMTAPKPSPINESTRSWSPTASANALCACSPPNGTSSSFVAAPASTSP